jgi:hypothetical protein
MYQSEVKWKFVERYCNPSEGWEVFVDLDPAEMGNAGGPRTTEVASARQKDMQARGVVAKVALQNIGAQVGGSRDSWMVNLRAKYPRGALPVVPGDRDIVAINPISKNLVVAEAEGDSAGQPEQKLYKAIGQIVIGSGETVANGYEPSYVLVLSGDRIDEHAIRAKALQRLGISALHISDNKDNDEWLFGRSGPSKRKVRRSQFLKREAGSYMHLSYPLVRSALSNLELSLQDRREPVFREADNHYSHHGVGSIVMLVSGFDSLLNEIIDRLGDKLRDLAVKPITSRYYEIPWRHIGQRVPANKDLDLLMDIRHEVVHGLPRVINESHNVPVWLSGLQERGLFVTAPGGDFALGWKIGSYKVCYWAWETISFATKSLLNTVDEARMAVQMTVDEMERFREVCSPEKLVEFDEKHGLEISNWK